VRVLVVSDDPLARQGLTQLLAAQPGIEIVGERSAADETAEDDADALVWDVGWSGEGLEPLRRMAAAGSPVIAVVADEDQAGEALAAGARGVLLRDTPADRLGAALEAAVRGLVVLDESLAEGWLRRPAPAGASLPEPLTPRELEVLELLAQGLSNKAIAARLGISDHTAKFHVNAILGKLGAQSRTEAIVQAARLGLVVL
jgi:DNA-binding NarL/FixJ family response regulator